MEATNTEIITIGKQQLIDIIADVIDNLGKDDPKETFNRFMTVQEVCEYTGYKRPTIYSFVHTNQIPYKKNKGKLFFNRAEISEWMNQTR